MKGHTFHIHELDAPPEDVPAYGISLNGVMIYVIATSLSLLSETKEAVHLEFADHSGQTWMLALTKSTRPSLPQ